MNQHQQEQLTFTQRVDLRALKFTPIWFDWLKWMAAVAALQYLWVKSQHPLLALLVIVSFFVLLAYFHAFFSPWKLFPRLKEMEAFSAVLTIMASGATAYLFWWTSYTAAMIIASNH